MKKLILTLLVILMLTGCRKEARQLDEEKYDAYLTYYQSILDYENKLSSSQNYDIKLAANKINDELYRYDVIIDNTRIAMYGIEILVIIDDLTMEIDTSRMMPSIGIFDEEEYTMIPNQIDRNKNIVRGIDLSFTTNEDNVSVSVMVSFYDKDKTRNTKEYFSLSAEYIEPEPQEETTPQA